MFSIKYDQCYIAKESGMSKLMLLCLCSRKTESVSIMLWTKTFNRHKAFLCFFRPYQLPSELWIA